jgi:hypothetical protein
MQYGGNEKRLVEFEGTHNGSRPAEVWDAMSQFVCAQLGNEAVAPPLLSLFRDAICERLPFLCASFSALFLIRLHCDAVCGCGKTLCLGSQLPQPHVLPRVRRSPGAVWYVVLVSLECNRC